MQPTENFSVPRRALDVEDYIDVVRRHKAWIFGPFLLTLVASVVGVYLAPDSYVSQAVVKIVPQQVPESMVQSAVNQAMADRINSMSQTILSRTALTTIINNFGLYQRERSRTTIEDVIEQMRKDIQILPVGQLAAVNSGRNVPAFAVQFSYENRIVAQRVVQELVGRFIDENIRNRSNATFQTTEFMQNEQDRAKRDLDEVETRLAQFRLQNAGRLPDQMDANMRQLAALQAQVVYLDSAISRSNQDKLQIEANLKIYKDQQAVLNKEPENSGPQKSEAVLTAEREVQLLEGQLTTLRQHYKENHPDVVDGVARLAASKERLEEAKKEQGEEKPPPKAAFAVREARDLDATIRRFQSAVEAKDLEIQEYTKTMKRSSEAIKAFESRLVTIPLGERQYGELLRDREIAKQKYIDLDEKLGRAKIAQEMEGRKQGETLELLDPASLPQNPTEPKRPLVISIGAGLGLLLGIVIAGAREMKDTSLKNLKDVRAYTQMTVLGCVPLLENDFVVRRRRRLAWLGWTTSCLAAAVVMSASVVYYYVTKI